MQDLDIIGDIHKDDWLTYQVRLTSCKMGAEGRMASVKEIRKLRGKQKSRKGDSGYSGWFGLVMSWRDQ